MKLVMTRKELDNALNDYQTADDPSDFLEVHEGPVSGKTQAWLTVDLGNGQQEIPIEVVG